MKSTSLVALVILALYFTGCSQKSNTNQPPTTSAADGVPASDKESYRELKKEDGFSFEKRGGIDRITSGSPPSGVIMEFGLVDSSGTFVPLELIDHDYTNGIIRTKIFGDVHYSQRTAGFGQFQSFSSPPSETYEVTEIQIRQILEYLAARARK